ncbi:gamma-glutamyltransferase [Streptomyces sp. NPDC059743]|uniref:gamma-glutamyltransferase n=1 Tax=Streptomyces sp. NPDC059743 TaxID=3346928 RepID=UPI00366207BB
MSVPTRTIARRAVASGTLGAVASGSRTASGIGLAALLDGGNAFDAALAAAFAETVVMPSKCGLAGDLVALYVTADDEEPVSVIALGGAPAGLYAAVAARNWQVPATGPLSVGVPGAPAGYAHLGALGRMSRERLVSPAVALARRGFPWSRLNVLLTEESLATLTRYQPDGGRCFPATGPLAEGEVVRMPGLAGVLERFVHDGSDLFAGELGRRLVGYVQEHGGVLGLDDLGTVEVIEERAHSVESEHGRLWATNGPSYGIALTRTFDREHRVDRGAPTSPDAVAQALAALARGGLQPALTAEGTSTVSAADADGNAVVIVHSNSFPQYGSGLVLPGDDLVLANRAGRGFTFEADHPNAPRPGQRPLTTLHAWALKDATRSWVLGATPGGAQQVPWNAQVIDQLTCPDLLDGPARMGAAVTAPKWEISDRGVLREGAELPPLGARSAHTLVRLGPDLLSAAADPRWDATAVAS